MNFLQQITGGRSGPSTRSTANSVRSAHSHGAAYSHRSTKESVGRRVHADTDHHTGVSSSKIGVGAAIIMLRDGVDPASHAAPATTNNDGKIIPHDRYFVAVLAPDSDCAMAYLASQPAGTYLLVHESGDEIAVYIKFVQAVRSFTVVKSKDIKKKTGEELVDWGKPYHTLSHSPRHVEALLSQATVMAPVHRISLPLDAYQFLEKCWLKFLPQVQAIVFELCSQPFYMDEDIAMEDWSAFILSSRVSTIAFLSVDSCGFHLINTCAIADAAFNDSNIAAAAASAAAVVAALSVPVRLVEFDVSKCLLSITDGVFRPSSFVTPVNFGNAKLYDAELGFATIRANFLTPERVALKEASGSTTSSQASGAATVASPAQWQDLGMSAAISGDAEMQLLLAMHKCTASMIPHEPLPEGFVDSFARLHTLWSGQTPAQCRGRWRTPDKVKCAARILPYYLELFLAVATTDPHVTQELRTTGKPNLLPCFAAALRHDVLHMARRVDDETVARLVLQVLQALQLRADVPSQLVSLVSDLVVESPQFRVLFMRNQGANLLWKAIHMAVSMNAMISPQLLMQTLSLQRNTPLLGETTKRRSSLFGGRRKSNSRLPGGSSRRSMAFNSSLVMPVTMECSVQVYFRVNPILLQLEVAPQLRETQFSTLDLASRAHGSDLQSSVESALTEMIHFIERVAFFLMADPSSPTWEKDVMQLLRMEDLYEHLYREAVTCVMKATSPLQRRFSISVQTDAADTSVDPILECISSMYRLETKRRRHTTTGIGEKRYWFLFHLLRNPVRAFHEAMREIMNALDNGEISTAIAQPEPSQTNANYAAYDLEDRGPTATTGFFVLAQVLPKLPMQLVTEFVLVSLDDLLQATRILYEFIQRGLVGGITYVRLLVSIFTIILTRTCDYDLQLLLVRVLASSGSSLPALLQLLAKESTTLAPEAGGTAIELEMIAFVEAFVTLATSLVRMEKWHEIHETLYTTLENKEDVEGNEQRKTMLMATVLSPENGVADSDEILWDTMQSILLPTPNQEPKDGDASSRLRIVDCFLSKDIFTVWDCETGLVPYVAAIKLRAMKAYLRVRARLFLSSILENSKATLPHLRTQVEFHWDHIYELREQYKTTLFSTATTTSSTTSSTRSTAGGSDNTVKIDGSECQELVLLHLQCVIALASRRSALPALDEAFRDFRTARELLRILRVESSKAIAAASSSATSASSSAASVLASLPPSLDSEPKTNALRSPMGLSLNLDKLSQRTMSWSDPSNLSALAVPSWKTDELLLSSPTLHATTLVAIFACVVSEPHTLSESLVPRFFIPQSVDGSSLNVIPDEDLLLTLQRHLSFANSPELRDAIHAALQTCEFEQLFGSTARAHAVRTLTRILLPDSYDSHLFQTAPSSNCISVREHRHQTTTMTTHGGDESDGEDHVQAANDDPQDPLAVSPQPRTYIAKGAFASVYRAAPAVNDALHKQVAIKVWAHQQSSGDLCVAAELFNEITVLEHLQGNMAATQLLDYGNDTRDNQGFEVVMEHCPTTLAQWRRSLEAEPTHPMPQQETALQVGESKEAPFRTLLSLVLSVFVDVASALREIHGSHVCHFDVKADNVLVRVDATTLTVETLKKLRQHTNEAGAKQDEGPPRICLADFGESIVVPPLSEPGGVVLSRTRGTEAIKSPEMLNVRGGASRTESSSEAKDSNTLVGPASDVWSLGCLLFELVAEELMFANDDWAQLYAHVVAAPSTTPIVRDDHRHKLLRALRPKTDAEKGLAGVFIDFLGSILQRNAATRPTIDKVVAEAQIQLRMIQSLPSQPEDEAFERMMERFTEPSSVPTLLLPAVHTVSSVRPKIVETAHSPALGRLFFNFYLAKDVWALHRATPSQTPSTAASASAIAMATAQDEARLRRELSSLQLRYESSFTHFIYFCYDDVKRRLLATNNPDSYTASTDVSASRHGGSSTVSDGSASEFVEIVEGVGRTVLYFSRTRVLACLKEASDANDRNGHGGGRASAASSFSSSVTSARGTTSAVPATTATEPSGLSLMRLLLQYSRGILPVLQRHLHHQSNRVLIVPADYNAPHDHDAEAASGRPLTELTASTLLFFLVVSCGLSPLQAQVRFSRECGAILDLPSPRLLQQLHRLYDQLQSVTTSVSISESTAQSRCIVRCRCGDKVLAVPSASLSASTETLPCTADNAALVDCEAEAVWDCGDTNVVHKATRPFSRWRVVDTLAVDRLDSQLRTVLLSQLSSTAAGAAAPSSQRRRSHNLHASHSNSMPAPSAGSAGGLLHHHHHHDAALALREHVPFLLRGLHETQTIEGDHASQRTETSAHKPPRPHSWSVYECALCGGALCALATATDKVALPVG